VSKVVNLKQFRKSKEPQKRTDPWCAKLVCEDGKVLSGGCAREKRLSLMGGVGRLLEMADQLARKSS